MKNGNCSEINFSETVHELVEHARRLAQELLAARQRFLSKFIYQPYNGYVMSQFKKLEHDLCAASTALRETHIQLGHLTRRAWEAKSNGNTPCTHAAVALGHQVLRECELRVRLDEHRAALLAIKRGEQPWPKVNAWRLCLHKEFDEVFTSTELPERPDYASANEFLLKARREMVNLNAHCVRTHRWRARNESLQKP